MTYLDVHLTPSLLPGSEDRALRVLGAYYAPLGAGGFTGGQFDEFDPSATRAASANVFTADDVVAVSLLSVDVSGRATLELLDRQRARFTALLAAAGPDMDLVDVESTDPQRFPVRALNDALRGLPNVGPTTASKLLARKRPRLIPIFDSVINEYLLTGTGRLWEPLRLALRADDQQLHRRLLDLRAAAGLGEHISAIRILDVLAWMDGSGHSDRVLGRSAMVDQDHEVATELTKL